MVFEGVRGTSYRGDIAIDDITFATSPCTQSGNLDLMRLTLFGLMDLSILIISMNPFLLLRVSVLTVYVC